MTFIPVIAGSGAAGFNYLQTTRTAQLERMQATPEIARDVSAFKERIKDVASPDDLLNDRTLLRVALGAFGLDEDINNQAFLRQVLTSDLSDSFSMVNRLTDKRYLAFAQAFNFEGGQAQIPSTDPVPALQAEWDRLPGGASDLFKFRNNGLLERSLAAFGLEADKANTVFLGQVLKSDVDDPGSLVNRLENKSYLAFARAFQGKIVPMPPDFLAKFDAETVTKLQAVGSAKDLMGDRDLLSTVLDAVGLSGGPNLRNDFFLESVLNSDIRDPDSLANRLSDPRFAELAEAFDFDARNRTQISIYDFADAFEGKTDGLTDVDQLLDAPDLLRPALRVFGLDATDPDTAFLREVLTSDLDDPASVANQQSNPVYASLAGVFGFGAMLSGTDQATAQEGLTNLIDAATTRSTPPTTVARYLEAFDIVLATQRFFGLPDDLDGLNTSERVVESDPTLPVSLYNIVSDDRYRVMYGALALQTESDGTQSYPAGFGEAITSRFLERQFEIRVGEIDPDARLALSLERGLEDIIAQTSSNDGRWFSILASPPLRSTFETAFGLPSAFAGLDIERQVADLKVRAEALFGTSDVADLTQPEVLEDMRARFFAGSSLTGGQGAAGSGYNVALAVLTGAI